VSSKPTQEARAQIAPADPVALRVEDVVREHDDSLKSFLRRRLRVVDDAEDVAQEAYVRLLHYEGATDVRSPPALLRRIAANAANDRTRADQVRHAADHVPLEDLDLPDLHPSAECELSAEQDLARVIAAIERLPPKCQQVFLLSRLHGFSYLEIARHCGISVKMVEKHVSRALAFCLREVGDDPSGTS
jgi:RNA polymerase sigma factor (sigma-70 family)